MTEAADNCPERSHSLMSEHLTVRRERAKYMLVSALAGLRAGR